jgi:hypothetical protein
MPEFKPYNVIVPIRIGERPTVANVKGIAGTYRGACSKLDIDDVRPAGICCRPE